MIDSLFYIRDGVISPNIEKEEPFQHAVEFCKQWTAGQENFTISTSGSTGTPKEIEISRSQMEASAKMTVAALGLLAGDNALVCLNTDYIAGKMMLVRGMVCKLNLYITKSSSNPLEYLPNDLQIDFMAVVPLQLELIIETGGIGLDKLNQMKAVIVGGAPVSPELAQKTQELSCPIYATYGMTETLSHIALKRINGADVSGYFQVLDDVTIAQDDRGCLTINSILTNNETIVTNDMVNIIEGNRFEWLGRADHVINSGGIKIHPEQLENEVRAILAKHHIGYNLIIAGIPDSILGEKAVLILETVETSVDTEDLKKSLKKKLPVYQYPREIYCLEKFVYTETGKVKRKETANLISEVIP